MGMSTHVIGIKPPDDLWRDMKAVWDACITANVDRPDAVEQYFEGEEPDPAGVIVDSESLPTRKWSDESREGIEIDIDTLPAGVKTLRFYNAW